MTLYISNMDSRTCGQDLLDLLAEYNPSRTSNMRSIMDTRSRNFNTFCYVELDTEDKVTAAIAKYNDTILLGRKIKVEKAG